MLAKRVTSDGTVARIEYEGALYHLTGHGNERQRIFVDEHDRPITHHPTCGGLRCVANVSRGLKGARTGQRRHDHERRGRQVFAAGMPRRAAKVPALRGRCRAARELSGHMQSLERDKHGRGTRGACGCRFGSAGFQPVTSSILLEGKCPAAVPRRGKEQRSLKRQGKSPASGVQRARAHERELPIKFDHRRRDSDYTTTPRPGALLPGVFCAVNASSCSTFSACFRAG